MRKIAFLLAAAGTWMQHLAVHTQEQPCAANEWLEPVSEQQYMHAAD
ncbi:MAG: hypothetical protein II970_08440 [Paludibacteraceae bacterium]|nr:hypothetical protein [Paludibacteraceae bacterium]